VDDIVAGTDTEEEAVEFHHQVIFFLLKGGFNLKKWASNYEALLKDISAEDRTMDASFEL